LNSQSSPRRREGMNESLCGTCVFFGKLSLCPRRERYEGAIPCRKYERETEETSPIFPLLPDTGVRESKEEMMKILEGPTFLWYLVPFFFGVLGGIVAYVAVKDRDEDMASGLLLFGIIWTVIGVILYFAVLSYYLSLLF
jgi:hypothetical protein